LALALWLGLGSILAAETGVPQPETARIPYYTERVAGDWSGAQWIALGDAAAGPRYVLFRREFELEEVPDSAVLHVASGDRYRVTVNGQGCVNGDVSSDYVRMFYDSYEVASLLKKGQNVIALEVFTPRPKTLISKDPAIPKTTVAALLEVSSEGGQDYRNLLVTDAEWTATPGEAWVDGTGFSTLFDVPEVFGLARMPRNWNMAGGGQGWPAVRLVKAVVSETDERQPLQMILPRLMPRLAREFVAPASVVEVGEVVCLHFYQQRDPFPALQVLSEQIKPLKHCKVEGLENLLAGGSGICVIENEFGEADSAELWDYIQNNDDQPMIRHASIVLDMGEMMNGYFTLEAEGPAGAIIDISYAQVLQDGRLNPVPLIKWNEVESEGGGPKGLLKTDRITLAGGAQTWTGFQLRHLRYVQLTFRNLDGPLTLKKFGVLRESQPYSPQASFQSSDPLLNKVWEADRNTFFALVRHMVPDNMTREKSPWGGEVAVHLFTGLAQFGDLPVLRHYISLFRHMQGESGVVPNKAFSPSYKPQGQLDNQKNNYPFHLFIQADVFAEYYRYLGDSDFKREVFLPLITGQADWLLSNVADDGLISPEMRIWYDWSSVPEKGWRGFVANAYAIRVFERTADLLEAGDPRAKRYREAAARMREILQRDFWVPERGMYSDALVDGKPVDRFTEHAATFALALDLVPGERREQVLSALSKSAEGEGELGQFNVTFAATAWRNLFEAGEPDLALKLMRQRYPYVFRGGVETISEEWFHFVTPRGAKPLIHYRSIAQAGTGVPSFFFLTRLLGVQSANVDFREILIAPEPVDLDWAEGAMPSPHGLIPVRWDKKGDEFHIKVTVPEGATAKVRFPAGYQARTLNGGEVTGEEIPVSAGEHTLAGVKK
jgi:alpha-L-rhamnosidase